MWVRKIYSLWLIFFFLNQSALGSTEKLLIDKTPLILNGEGTYVKSIAFLSIPVFEGSLYLEHPMHNASEIIGSPQIKLMKMKFLLGIAQKRMQGGWKDSFSDRCDKNQPCHSLKETLDTLISWIPEVEKNDTHEFTFFPDHVEFHVTTQGTRSHLGSLPAAGLTKYLLDGWIGDATQDKNFQSALLGKK